MTNEHEAANVRAELARLLEDAADKDLAAFVRHHWPTIDVALYFATRAAPRKPGKAERLKAVLDWFNGDGESLVYRAIEGVVEDGHYNVTHVAQYSCDAIARLLRDQVLAALVPIEGEGE